METDRIFPPNPMYKLYAYPIIPNATVKKFIALLPDALHKFLDDQKTSQFYGLLATFIQSFEFQDLYDLIDNPNQEQYIKVLETNPLYAPSKGGMDFIQFTPIFTFRNWLVSNLYEGPPIHLRPDYVEDAFDENKIKVICGGRFSHYKDMYDRLNDFSSNFENQTLEQFTYLTRRIFSLPL